jgi:hypothetical protein
MPPDCYSAIVCEGVDVVIYCAGRGQVSAWDSAAYSSACLVCAARRLFGLPGAARRLVTFLASPRKVTQRRRHPSTAPTGFPALLAKPGGCGTRALRSDSPRRNPPTRLRYSAVDQGEFKPKQPIPILAFPLKRKEPLPSRLLGESLSIRPSMHTTRLPLCTASGLGERSGAVGEDCLSAKREFRSRPIFSENRGKPEGPVRRGALLFGYLYFGQAK